MRNETIAKIAKAYIDAMEMMRKWEKRGNTKLEDAYFNQCSAIANTMQLSGLSDEFSAEVTMQQMDAEKP